MSSITYHFGGKQGLYLAAADHIAGRIITIQSSVFEAARSEALRAPERSLEMLLALLDSLAAMMLHSESEAWSRFIMREQQDPTEAFERIYAGVIAPLSTVIIELIANVRPDLDEPNRRATAVLLVGQAMILRAGRASVSRILGVEQIDASTSALLRARLRANARCILEGK